MTSIQNSNYTLNEAKHDGGAIYYDRDTPTLDSNTYGDNKAAYGANVGSYPVKFLLDGENKLELKNLASGQINPTSFTI